MKFIPVDATKFGYLHIAVRTNIPEVTDADVILTSNPLSEVVRKFSPYYNFDPGRIIE